MLLLHSPGPGGNVIRIGCSLCLLLLLAQQIHAQQSELHVNPGVRVRVAAPALTPEPVRGWVVSLTPDTLVLRSSAEGVRLHLPRPEIRLVEIGIGRDPWGRGLRGGTFGVLAGLVVGVAYSAANDLDLASIPLTFGMMTLGGVSGIVLGATTAPERWMRIYAPAPAASGATERP
jgi:hypothetical protein